MQIKSTMLLFALLPFVPGLAAQQHDHAQAMPPPADQIAVPDLLKDAASQPPLRLEQFQQFALATNPTLPEADALVRQSSAQARQAGLYPNPSVGYQGEQIRGGAYNGGEQGAFAQQTFVLGGKLGLRRHVYEQQRRADELTVQEQRYRVMSDVGQSFYAALTSQEVVNVRKKLLSLAMDAVATAQQLANVGQADAPDLLQAEVEAEQAKMDYTTAQRAYIQAFRGLAAIAGKPELTLSPLEGNLHQPPQIDADRVVNQIVKNSPAVKRARQDFVRAQAEIKSAKRESIPDLVIRGGVQQNNEPINETTGLRTGFQAFASAGIDLPIFNRNQGNVAAANAELERARAEVSRVQLSLRQNAQTFLQNYLSSEAQAVRYKNEMIPRAARAYELYLAKYHQMGAAYPQVLISQRTLFQLQVGYTNALGNVWSTAIALQNYTLSSGLSAPMPAGNASTTFNLPNSGNGGVQ
jgi:cobalt-zinc-cadmium efflux system outer membrane protein